MWGGGGELLIHVPVLLVGRAPRLRVCEGVLSRGKVCTSCMRLLVTGAPTWIVPPEVSHVCHRPPVWHGPAPNGGPDWASANKGEGRGTRDVFPDSSHVALLGLAEATDEEVMVAAKMVRAAGGFSGEADRGASATLGFATAGAIGGVAMAERYLQPARDAGRLAFLDRLTISPTALLAAAARQPGRHSLVSLIF